VTLCLDVPVDLFNRHDVSDKIMTQSGYRLAIIPALELNRLGVKPQVYDHELCGCSRRDLLRAAEKWEAEEDRQNPDALAQHAQSMRDAISFFDRIGWRTPLKLREESQT
jgi:hypothetical protein